MIFLSSPEMRDKLINSNITAKENSNTKFNTTKERDKCSTIDMNGYQLSHLLAISLFGAFLLSAFLAYRWQSARERKQQLKKFTSVFINRADLNKPNSGTRASLPCSYSKVNLFLCVMVIFRSSKAKQT